MPTPTTNLQQRTRRCNGLSANEPFTGHGKSRIKCSDPFARQRRESANRALGKRKKGRQL